MCRVDWAGLDEVVGHDFVFFVDPTLLFGFFFSILVPFVAKLDQNLESVLEVDLGCLAPADRSARVDVTTPSCSNAVVE